MIYLITGQPGSGKTLMTVGRFIKELMGQKLKDEKGNEIERRLCVDGIPALALDHQPLAETVVEDKQISVRDEGCGLGNWWEWCKPGDLIVIDEVQRYTRPRALGTKPPKMVTELETHRHKGVDFIFITQSPALIDQNIRRLVNRHQHVRRLFGGARAIVYDWDGCQNDTSRVSSAVSKRLMPYPKDAYKLYRSSELHTKQKQAIPAWVIVPVLAIAGGVFIAPKAYSVMHGAASGKGVSAVAVPTSTPTAVVTPGTAQQSPVALPPAPAAQVAVAVTEEKKEVEELPDPVGCIANDTSCKCFTKDGKRAKFDPSMCMDDLPAKTVSGMFGGEPMPPMSRADLSMIEAAHRVKNPSSGRVELARLGSFHVRLN